MALEDLTGSDKFIDNLVNTNPASGDQVQAGDDHIRGVKNVLLNTFPNVDGAVNPSVAEFNRVVGVTENIQPALDSANAALASVQALQPRLWPRVANGTDAEHDIDFSAGIIMDSAGDEPIELTSVLTKRVDANWVAGNDAGGFPSGLTIAADTTYHLFVIKDVTNNLVDAGFDTSLTATNLLTDASDYTKYRRIASIKTDASSNFIGFTQSANDPHMFFIDDPSNTTEDVVATSARLITLTQVPFIDNLEVELMLTWEGSSPASSMPVVVSSIHQPDEAPTVGNTPHATINDNSGTIIAIHWRGFTDSSAQIRHRASATISFSICQFRAKALNWRDMRIV